MATRLQEEIRQTRPFRSLEAEAFLNILRTADVLGREFERMLKPYGLTSTQYNVLRILCGSGDMGATCSEISERMITEAPDMTRLLDRLEQRGLISRERGKNDRRVVRTRITESGQKLVDELDEPVDKLHLRQFQGTSQQELPRIIRDMEAVRTRGGQGGRRPPLGLSPEMVVCHDATSPPCREAIPDSACGCHQNAAAPGQLWRNPRHQRRRHLFQHSYKPC